MSKDTIVFYIASLAKGGAERVLCNLANAYAGKGFKTYILTDLEAEEEYTDLDSRIERVVIPKISGKISFLRVKKRIGFIRDFLIKTNASYMVSFMRKCNLRAVQASKGLKVRTILSVRSAPEREYPGLIKKALAKHYFKLADGAVFQTQEARAFFPKKVQNKSVVLMNSVKPAYLIPRYEGEREKVIVTCGRLHSVKNHELIVRAFDQIKEKYPDYQVRIYGGGSNSNLEKVIADLGLTEKVLLMGNTDDVVGAIHKASLFLLSSNAEGMPNALIEAMSLGLPCVSTDCPCGGPAAVIQNGENGILIPVGDADALAKAMDKVLSDSEYANLLGRNAAKIQQQIHPDKVNQMWMDYIETGRCQ